MEPVDLRGCKRILQSMVSKWVLKDQTDQKKAWNTLQTGKEVQSHDKLKAYPAGSR